MASRTELSVALIAVLTAACLLMAPRCADAARPLDAASVAPRRTLQQQGFWSGMPAPSSTTTTATASAIGTITSVAAVASSQDNSAPFSSSSNDDPRVAGKQQFDGTSSPAQQPQSGQQSPRCFRTYRGGYRPSFTPQQQQQQQQQPATWQQPQASQQQEVAPSAVSSPQQPAAVPSSGAGASGAAAGPSGDMSAVLSLHNSLRARHGTAPLAWSNSLAAASQEWADRCVFAHSNGGGENLAQYLSPMAAVQAWYDEIRMYDYGAGQYSSATGHATQLLWRGSTELGCGWAPSCQYLVCRYSPPGNVLGYFTENVSPPTSR